MKKVSLYLFFTFTFYLTVFSQTLDVSENSQNLDLLDTAYVPVAYTYDANFEQATFISNTFQIPAHGLYSQHWDTLNIRSHILEIPFYEDQIKVQLLQSEGGGIVFPTSGEMVREYGLIRRVFHPGIDFEVAEGAPIVACFPGVVRVAKYCVEYGNTVIIRHYNGLETLYAHLGELSVKANQVVKLGMPIGTAGKTGNVGTTEKGLLHFEIRFLNHYFDPALMLNMEERKLNDQMLTITANDINTVPLPAPPYPDKLAIYNQYIARQVAANIPTTPLDTLNTEIATPETETEKENEEENEKETVIEEQPVVIEKEKEEKEEVPPTSNQVFHTVQQGETLYRISVKYKVSTTEIIKLNNLKGDGSNIRVGQRLRVN